MNTKRSLRFFNTTGTGDPNVHYMLPSEVWLGGEQLHHLYHISWEHDGDVAIWGC